MMTKVTRKSWSISAAGGPALALALLLGATAPTDVRAGEAEAKTLLKAMSDYMASQKNISFEYDSTFEVVGADNQKIALASSGTVALARPDKIRASRVGGFANVESVFDGKTLTVFGKNANVYTQVDIPGTIDHLIDELKDKYHRPLPAADLLLSNAYEQLMPEVLDVKDLGSGVIGGIECDHLAFRNKEVDWQIWIAQGDRPYPCRFVITSKLVANGPQYSIQLRNWKSAGEVATGDFGFKAPAGAQKIDIKDLKNTHEMDDMPSHFVRKEP
jgi:hypothetical protein